MTKYLKRFLVLFKRLIFIKKNQKEEPGCDQQNIGGIGGTRLECDRST